MPMPDAQKLFAHLNKRLDSNRRQTWDKSSIKLFLAEGFNELLVTTVNDPQVPYVFAEKIKQLEAAQQSIGTPYTPSRFDQQIEPLDEYLPTREEDL